MVHPLEFLDVELSRLHGLMQVLVTAPSPDKETIARVLDMIEELQIHVQPLYNMTMKGSS